MTASPFSRAEASTRLGAKVRALRRREGLTQVKMAEQLGVSASFLNLIESNRRSLPATLLIKIAQTYGVDLHAFGVDEDARVLGDLLEAFSDPLFESHQLTSSDLRELIVSHPHVARAVVALYSTSRAQREAAQDLSPSLDSEEVSGHDRSRLPSEEVSDFIQRHMNHFPELERAAEDLWKCARLDPNDLHGGLVRWVERELGVRVCIASADHERGILRKYDPAAKSLSLSEFLPAASRTFQLAHQIALLTQSAELESLLAQAPLTTAESRALARVALANYFAGAVLMPYEPFLDACRRQRHDIDVIARRFRVGFEPVCHRFTTLRRPGAEGVPFHLVRIDIAGNISKHFSGDGLRFARFSGACPRWNVFAAFMTPGMIRTQLSRFADGSTYFCIARTVLKESGGYHSQKTVHALGLGCRVEHAKTMVYADDIDLKNPATVTPVGVTCRLCERDDCEQRACPSFRHSIQVDENVRGPSLYAKTLLR